MKSRVKKLRDTSFTVEGKKIVIGDDEDPANIKKKVEKIIGRSAEVRVTGKCWCGCGKSVDIPQK
jgi:hypothetical protein